jgi:hypothetical protein
MALMDGTVWRGEIYSGGIVPISGQTVGDEPNVRPGAGGAGARFGGAADPDACRVTIRGDITPYPF